MISDIFVKRSQNNTAKKEDRHGNIKTK
jgi:hypothetical protein